MNTVYIQLQDTAIRPLEILVLTHLEANKASSSNSRQLDNEQHMYNASTVIVSESGLIVFIGDVVPSTCNEV